MSQQRLISVHRLIPQVCTALILLACCSCTDVVAVQEFAKASRSVEGNSGRLPMEESPRANEQQAFYSKDNGRLTVRSSRMSNRPFWP